MALLIPLSLQVGTPLSLVGGGFEALRQRSLLFGSDLRKIIAFERYNVYKEDYKALIGARIDKRYQNGEHRERMKNHINTVMNPLLDITKAVAVVYKNGARRIIEGSSKRTQKAFDDAYAEAKTETKAKEWNRLPFATGMPLIVVPNIRKGKLSWDFLLPHTYDPVLDENDPLGDPIAVAYTVVTGANNPDTDAITTVILDDEAWHIFSERGELRDVIPHGLGIFPGVTFRLSDPVDADWFDTTFQWRLFDGTIEVGMIMAAMGLTRKNQNKKVPFIFGDIDGIPRGQLLFDGEVPFTAQVPEAQAVNFGMVDAVVSPDEFIKHIRFIYSSQIESYGIPTESVDLNINANQSISLAVSHDKLADVRNEQIPFMRIPEHDLAWKASLMMRALGHPSGELIDPAQVKEDFRIDYPVLNRVDDPLRLMKLHREEMRMGLISPVDVVQMRHPTMTRDAAKALIMRNARERGEIIKFLAENNIPEEMSPASPTPEQNGREGGIMGGPSPNTNPDTE